MANKLHIPDYFVSQTTTNKINLIHCTCECHMIYGTHVQMSHDLWYTCVNVI